MGSPNNSQILFRASPEPSEGRQKEASQLTKEAFPAKPEERAANWPALLVSSPGKPLESALSGSPIQPGQKPTENTTPASWKICQKSPYDYDRDKVGKYVPFFQGNVILPIPEISEALFLRIIPLVFVDIKTGRFVGLKKILSRR